MNRTIPEPESSDPKEVYAFFGFASNSAQLLEQELIILALAFTIAQNPQIPQDALNRVTSTLEGHTLGTLLREARQLTPVPPDLESHLKRALAARNDLIHRFFARHAENFLSERGRLEMIDELRGTIKLLQSVESAIASLRDPVSKALGITDTFVDRKLGEMVEKAILRDWPA